MVRKESSSKIIFFVMSLFLMTSFFGFLVSASTTISDISVNSTNFYGIANQSDTLDGYNSSYFFPLNTSVFGNFDFNGGWENGGLSIQNGDIYAQTGYFYNITSLNVTKQNLTVNDNAYFVGKVGIGTATPQNTLNVVGIGNFTSALYVNNKNVETGYDYSTNGTFLTAETNWNANYSTYGIPFNYSSALNGTLMLQSNWNATNTSYRTLSNLSLYGGNISLGGNQLFVDNVSGNVGVGTASPNEKLNIFETGSGTPAVNITTNNGGMILLNTYGSSSGVFGYLQLYRQGSIKSYIGLDGNNNTAILSSSASALLSVKDDGKVGIGRNAATYALEVQGDAGKTTGGTSWESLSDERLKTILSSNISGLDLIENLTPIKFHYNDLANSVYGSDTNKTYFGFTAQNVNQSIPEMVTQDSNGYLWYNPSGFEAILVSSIKEQQAIIQSQNDTINEQNQKISQLQTGLCVLDSTNKTGLC